MIVLIVLISFFWFNVNWGGRLIIKNVGIKIKFVFLVIELI